MSPIYLYNTLTRGKEEFRPITPGKVGMYTCGPTVYQYATIGNLRSYVFADVLRRVLQYNGLKVKMVMNITRHLVSDADEGEDKMLVAVGREKDSVKSPSTTPGVQKDSAPQHIETYRGEPRSGAYPGNARDGG